MWKNQKNSIICGYLEEYENQKKHIDRVLSAKEIVKCKKPPYNPKFLKLSKNHIEEDNNDKIRGENELLILKIMNAKYNPSKYSKIYEPKKCPAFDKELIYFKRIKKEINNYQENVRFYNKIGNARSYYENDEFKQRKKFLDYSCKQLQKSIFEISPSLLFLSPSRIKKEIDKYKNNNKGRNISKIMKSRTKSGKYSRHNSLKNNKKIKPEKSYQKIESSHNYAFLGPIQEDEEERNKEKENIENQNNYKNNNNNLKKLDNNKINDKSSKLINRKQRPKSALKRNESEVNLLN